MKQLLSSFEAKAAVVLAVVVFPVLLAACIKDAASRSIYIEKKHRIECSK